MVRRDLGGDFDVAALFPPADGLRGREGGDFGGRPTGDFGRSYGSSNFVAEEDDAYSPVLSDDDDFEDDLDEDDEEE